MKRLVAPLVVLLALAVTVQAGPLSRKQVAADADWLVHLNIRQFNASKLGQLLQSDRAPADIREPLAQSQEMLGFNPLADMEHATLYGRSEDSRSGIALFSGKFDRDKLLARIRQEKNLREIKVGSRTAYEWAEPRNGEIVALCFNAPGQMVFAVGPQSLQGALEVLDGKRPSLEPNSKLAIPEQARGFLLAVTAGDALKMNLLGPARGYHATVGETADGIVDARVNIQAQDEQMAASTLQVLQGILLSALMTAQQYPEWAELAQTAKVSAQGTTVTLQVQQSAEKCFALLLQQMAKRSAHSTAGR